jgi:SSS family solute:Na+ symporter
LEFYFPKAPFMNRSGIVFWTCIVVCIIVSYMTKPKPESELEGLIWNKESLKMPSPLRASMHGLKSPFLWWIIVTAMVLFFFIKYP